MVYYWRIQKAAKGGKTCKIMKIYRMRLRFLYCKTTTFSLEQLSEKTYKLFVYFYKSPECSEAYTMSMVLALLAIKMRMMECSCLKIILDDFFFAKLYINVEWECHKKLHSIRI